MLAMSQNPAWPTTFCVSQPLLDANNRTLLGRLVIFYTGSYFHELPIVFGDGPYDFKAVRGDPSLS